jgi:hypothetical protein
MLRMGGPETALVMGATGGQLQSEFFAVGLSLG